MVASAGVGAYVEGTLQVGLVSHRGMGSRAEYGRSAGKVNEHVEIELAFTIQESARSGERLLHNRRMKRDERGRSSWVVCLASL